jgi:NAD(P)-dependent dehydrogenase (short-subunit alcohol dehydrogenase family)
MTNTPDHNWVALTGSVCVVTGAASGIGAAIAEALATAGANAALLDRNADGCTAVERRLAHLPGRRISIGCDVSDEGQLREAAAQVEQTLGPCTRLVNAAGILRAAGLADVTATDWNLLMSVNLGGYPYCARTFRRQMLTAGNGSIVHVGPISGRVPQPWSGAYSASKAAVGSLSQQTAVEWVAEGIRSNVVAPGMIRTELTEVYYQHPAVLEERERGSSV